MQIHQIKIPSKKKRKKRIGRGGKRGTYSGRGMKGQRSRAGAKIRPELRDFIKSFPKKRGYRFSGEKKRDTASANLEDIAKNFKTGEKVTSKELVKRGIVKKINGQYPRVKILLGRKQSKLISGITFGKKVVFSDSAKKVLGMGGASSKIQKTKPIKGTQK